MTKGKWWLAMAVGAIMLVAGASIALADDAELDEGVYRLDLPFVGELFVFEVDYDGNPETVFEAAATPSGYEIDDDDPDKVAWKDMASLEVEAKSDKVEADHVWASGPAVLTLPDGETITITAPDGEGHFMVTTSETTWWPFGGGSDWYVANHSDINSATKFFKVEADEDGVEIKAVYEPDDGFKNELNETEDDALEIEAEEAEEEDKDKDKDDD